MFERLALPALVLAAWPVVAPAEGDDSAALFEALRLPEMLQIMREEGLEYGAEIGVDLFGGTPPGDWEEAVDKIYDPERMEAQVMAALEAATADVDLAPIVAFFTTVPGSTFVELEVAARRALLDDDVEQMAKEAAAMAMAEEDPLLDQVRRFVAANDFVEANVVSAMNSTYAFYLGLMDGGGFPAEMTEQDILGDVWAQEGTIRANTEEWIYSFLLMAYGPVPAEDIEAYIAFSESPEGRAANRIIFSAFDGMFEDMSLALGRVAARYMATQEL
jgi:hypothetical protein